MGFSERKKERIANRNRSFRDNDINVYNCAICMMCVRNNYCPDATTDNKTIVIIGNECQQSECENHDGLLPGKE